MARLEPFLDTVCDYRHLLQAGLVLLSFFLALTVFALVFGEPGTASYFIALLDLGLILVGIGTMGGLYWYCLRHERRRY